MPFCTKCGTQLADDAAFCSRCGAPQRGVTPAGNDAPPVPAVPPPPVRAYVQAPAPYEPPKPAPYAPPAPAPYEPPKPVPYGSRAPAPYAPPSPAPYVPPTPVTVPYAPPVRTPEGIIYSGEDVEFSLFGQTVTIPAELDCFNSYRKMYRALAKEASERLRSAFHRYIRTLDDYLERFQEFYVAERAPLLEEAYTTLQQLGYYDVSLESFTRQHTADFCLIQEDLNATINRFNATIEQNQNKRAHMFNMLPGVIFGGGAGGFAKALALNVGLNALERNAIARANVTPVQRSQIFAELDVDTLIERAYLDYWRIFLSLTYTMKSHGYPVAYPTREEEQRVANIYANLAANRIPENKIPEVLAQVLSGFPYSSDIFRYVNGYAVNNPEVLRLNEYIGFDGNEV